ncbi:MAG: tudor domain-containing protein, partial [bacterium]
MKSHCEKVGGPIWEVKYDESSIQWERRDLVRVVCFCSKDVLLDLQELGHDYGGTGGRCQWRMEGTKQEEKSLLTTGTRVKARYKGGTAWFAGTVASANRDGTYRVLY